MMVKYYAGIGSRKTNKHIEGLMSFVAAHLERLGYILRSGGAEGSDSAFEHGVSFPENKEIYLPWSGFNSRPSTQGYIPVDQCQDASWYVQRFHPKPSSLKKGAYKMMLRNTHQVLGANLDIPVSFVICWTPDGDSFNPQGGTGQAVRIARSLNIPVYNLGNEVDKKFVTNWLYETD